MRKFFFNDESGATLVEYGVALIVAVVVGGVALSTLAGETSDGMDATGSIIPNDTDITDWRATAPDAGA